MSNEKQLKEEIHRLTEEVSRLEEAKEAQQHEKKKALLEVANAKLDFQTRRADEYEEKYKSALQYKSQEDDLKELAAKLTGKENQVLRLMRVDHEKAQQIQELLQQMDQLKREKDKLSEDLEELKMAALNAIMDKDASIQELNDKLDVYENSQSIGNLRADLLELQEKCHQLSSQLESNRQECAVLLQAKEEQISELQQKMSLLKQKSEERVARLQNEIAEYERHIEQIVAERDHEQNFEEKYYLTEEKLRKAEKKLADHEQKHLDERTEMLLAMDKLEQEKDAMKQESQELREARIKVVQFQKTTEQIKHQWDQYRQKADRVHQEQLKKISHLQSEKKIISDSLKTKTAELERFKAEIEENSRKDETALAKEPSFHKTPQKGTSEDLSGLVEKLKKQNKDLEEANESLKRTVEGQTRQLQDSRDKLLLARSGVSSEETNKMRVTIEDLTSYLKKVENDMLMKKITHAQDENFWSIKEKKYKQQIDSLGKKYKKENSQLLERIDRMKKLIPKDKKTDYYQSGFK